MIQLILWADIQHFYDHLYLCLLCLIADWTNKHIHFGSDHVISVTLRSHYTPIIWVSDEAEMFQGTWSYLSQRVGSFPSVIVPTKTENIQLQQKFELNVLR